MSSGDDNSASSASPMTKGESVVEEERPLSPGPEDVIQGARRKSGTFWKRKSSLTLSNAFAAMNGKENQPQNAGLNGEATGARGGDTDGGKNSMTNGRHEDEEDVTMEEMDSENSLPEVLEPLPPRSYSPPPQLPLFVGGGGGLGGEDMFKDIH